MKERHKPSIRLNAQMTLKNLGLNASQDFHALNASQVEAILAAADHARYQKPKNANGSRARYFFQQLVRQAKL